MVEKEKIAFEKTIFHHVLKYCWNDESVTCQSCFGWNICKTMPDNLLDDLQIYERFGLIKSCKNGTHNDIMQSDFYKIIKHCYEDSKIECCDCPNDVLCLKIKKKDAIYSPDNYVIVLENRGFFKEFKVDIGLIKKEIDDILRNAISRIQRMMDDLE